MNILIVKLSAVGDVVHTLPSLVELRKLYPGAYICWAVEEDASDLIMDHPCLDRVLISHRKGWIRDIKQGRISSALTEIRSFLHDLRSRRYDIVIDFHGLLKSSIIVFLAKAKRKLGYDSMQELSGIFLNEKIYEDKSKHAVCRYKDFIRYLRQGDSASNGKKDSLTMTEGDCCTHVDEFIISIGKKEEARIATLMRLHGLNSGKFVALNPIALWETKLWQDEKFAALGDRIACEYKLPVVFTGGDRDAICRITGKMTTAAINLAGETSLRELACLYGKAAVVISTDSGPMHVAAAVRTPVVALFGPTEPARTGPFGENHIVIRKDISCSPCFLKKCPQTECMNRIGVDEVFEATGSLIGQKSF